MDVWSISQELEDQTEQRIEEVEATNSSTPYLSKMFKSKKTIQDTTALWYEHKEPWYKEAVENAIAAKGMFKKLHSMLIILFVLLL